MNILLAASMNELLQPLRTKQYTILNKKDERTSNNRYKVELLFWSNGEDKESFTNEVQWLMNFK
jgi:hypothetical protein